MRSTRHLLWGPAVGLIALAACNDPFGFDNSRQTPSNPGVSGPTPTPPPPTPPLGPTPVPMPPGVVPPIPTPTPPPGQPPPMMPPPVMPPPVMPPPVVPPPVGAVPPPVPNAPFPKCDQIPPAPGEGGEENEPPCPENAGFELRNWFPVTPEVTSCFPLAHPATECPFYQFSFQHFLVATQPKPDGAPDFLTWPSIENTFGAGAGKPLPPGPPILNSGVTQAGQRQILVDVNRNPIYYGIHFNKKFVEFVNYYQLNTVDGIKQANPELQFPADVVELKSAWQIIPPGTQGDNRMIQAEVRIPTLRIVNGALSEDYATLKTVRAQMIALHVVATIPGHPEFLWSTFEPVDFQNGGTSLVAPTAAAPLPPRMALNFTQNIDPASLGARNFALFGRMEPLTGRQLPVGVLDANLAMNPFNEMTQQFTRPTPVHRVYRASFSHTVDIDDLVIQLNEAVRARFVSNAVPPALQPNRQIDRRGNYILIGAIWQDDPQDLQNRGAKFKFAANKVLVNDPNDPGIIAEGPEYKDSITAGEDRLSSTAIESFTQNDLSFSNCFTCHNTQAATAKGVPVQMDQGSPILVEPKQINVSHVFNEVVRLTQLGRLK
jgi:hypothetical protein